MKFLELASVNSYNNRVHRPNSHWPFDRCFSLFDPATLTFDRLTYY